MPDPRKMFSIPVDVTNPGQFYACCGLLELATMADGEAVSWFDSDDCGFHLSVTTQQIIHLLTQLQVAEADADAHLGTIRAFFPDAKDLSAIAPVLIQIPASDAEFSIDWWLSPNMNALKIWAGSGGATKIMQTLHRSIASILSDHEEPAMWLSLSRPVQPKPFYFDCRNSGTAVDQGASADKLGLKVEFRPFTEFLTLIGLQRFRTYPTKSGNRRWVVRYRTWHDALPITLASAACATGCRNLSGKAFDFPIEPRDDKGHFSYGRAEPVEQLENQP